MRKYDMKNKRNIGIIIVISIIIVIMFSLVIKLFLSSDQKEYQIEKGSIVFDKDKTVIKIDNDAIIKTKWNNEYYLIYNDKNYELGKTALSFNENTSEIKLYGKYYEITNDSEINITSDETIIKNSLLTKFYKLEDRKYLIIDKEIKSADSLLSTTDFLIVEIDRVGNATLTNHKVSLKTFSETTIVTSNYTFDIANEILTYGNDKIDLKKIIGSSNNYKKEDLIPEDNTNEGNSSSNIVDNGQPTSDSNKGNGSSNGGNTSVEEIKKEAKNTSVISVTSTSSKIIIDYVIYDPYSEYSSVVLEVMREGSSDVDVIYLNSKDTRYELSNNITPNTKYNLRFKYSYVDENNELVTNEFQNIDIITKKVNIDLKVTRTKSGEITYLITPDASYNITSATVIVSVNNNVILTKEVLINGNTIDKINTYLNDNDIVEIKLTNVKSGSTIINEATASDKFIY